MSSEGEFLSPPPIHKWSRETQAQSFVLVLLSLLLTFTPSEAYIVPYLTRVKHFTNEQILWVYPPSLVTSCTKSSTGFVAGRSVSVQCEGSGKILIEIFPYGVYSTLFFTLLAAPACHYFTHKTVIIIGTFGKLATFVVQYYGESLFLLQLTQVTYGLGMASNFVFSSYIFLVFAEQDYQLMTSYTQASSLSSFFVAAELGQFLVDGGVSLVILLQITVVFAALACFVSFFLPRDESESQQMRLLSLEHHKAFQGVGELIRETWRGQSLRLLSFWWVFGTAGFSMILNYGTNLFLKIDPTSNTYGHIVAASQGAGSLGALAGVQLAPFAARKGGIVYVIGTCASGLCCIIMGWSNSLWVAYPAYVASIGTNQFLLCLIYVQCAKCLSNREFILLFSFNAAAALLVQSALQAVIEYLQLLVMDQFFVYGGYCIALAIVFWFLCHQTSLKTGEVEIIPSSHERTTLM